MGDTSAGSWVILSAGSWVNSSAGAWVYCCVGGSVVFCGAHDIGAHRRYRVHECLLRSAFACTRNARGIRERDTSQSVVVPKLGTTKILVARYKVSYVEGGKYSTGGSTYSKPAIWGGVLNKTCKIKISPPYLVFRVALAFA